MSDLENKAEERSFEFQKGLGYMAIGTAIAAAGIFMETGYEALNLFMCGGGGWTAGVGITKVIQYRPRK